MKVKVQKLVGKTYPHNLTHDVSTTSDYGFLQPLGCRLLSPGEKVTCRVGEVVRLNPVVKPTFGTIDVKTYHFRVLLADIWHPFESFLSGQTYGTSVKSYIATQVPTINCACLSMWLKCTSTVSFFYLSGYNGSNSNSLSKRASWTSAEFVTSSDIVGLSGSNVAAALVAKWSSITSHGITPLYLKSFWNWDNSSSYDSVPRADWYDVVNVGSGSSARTVLVCGYFNRYARNLRKIFIGCGYQFNNNADPLSVLPIFAFYKSYFDMFFPNRDLTWKDTNAYKLLEWIDQNGALPHSSWLATDSLVALWTGFLDDLAQCYYTSDPDYVSAHITGTQLPIAAENVDFPYLDNLGDSATVFAGEKSQAHLDTEVNQSVSQPGLNILRALTKRINIHTAIGGRIDKFLRAIFGADYVHGSESGYIGSHSLTIDVSTVMNQAETSEGFLGEYAGAGVGSSKGETFRFHPGTGEKSYCFYFVMLCVVPRTGYCQAVDPQLSAVSRYDYPSPDFDGITLLPTPKFNVYGVDEFCGLKDADSYSERLGNGFGNIPNYSAFKISMNKINGDMSLGSTRSSYLPFTVDKLLPFTELFDNSFHSPATDIFVNGSIWRYIGRDYWMGFFNRIFVNSGVWNSKLLRGSSFYFIDAFKSDFTRLDDNFIIQCTLFLKTQSYLKPMSQSFETGDMESDTMTVDKA